MPAKSKAQFRFMEMAKHNPEKMKGDHPTKAQAAEFVSSNVGKRSYSHLPEEKHKTAGYGLGVELALKAAGLK